MSREETAVTRADPVLCRLAELQAPTPNAEVSAAVRAAALARLCPRPIHPAWTIALVVSALSYLGWAVRFSSSLY